MGASVAFMQHRENPADGHEISKLARVQSLSNQIKPLLQGQGPEVQSVALADLVSLWLAGHPQEVREAVLALWLDTVRQLVPASVREVFGEHPPKGWETPQG